MGVRRRRDYRRCCVLGNGKPIIFFDLYDILFNLTDARVLASRRRDCILGGMVRSRMLGPRRKLLGSSFYRCFTPNIELIPDAMAFVVFVVKPGWISVNM